MRGSTRIRPLLAVAIVAALAGSATGAGLVVAVIDRSGAAHAESKAPPPAPEPEPAPIVVSADEIARHRADELGLGTAEAIGLLLAHAPLPDWVDAVEGRARATLHWPVDGGHYGRGFGFVRPHLPDVRHDGIDIQAARGTPVRAAARGLVAYADRGIRGYGNLVVLVHADGSTTLYAHLKSIDVTPGQIVDRGALVGEVGKTGRARGPHLHFELRVRGQPRNPMPRFARNARS